ncbi:MAG: hypothetical protein GTO55_11540, partial [Armatimonadetes bacterium]|nr:hypothetical protein [Armatimonadota bacterium]NIM24849.1 hypothetical protein [Armatimonadota bacterium]NIM68739.1 hypothetical protein [Armatimonadota bacterium]NIM76032.1 hypothetical protein [Armatimonadota bacterium]NIN06936.1 hypothetical protein [Armatimonadota bacterium]
MQTAEYAQLAEGFLSCLNREEYLHLSGQKDTFDTEAIFEEFGSLFTRDAVLERLEKRGDLIGRYLAEFAVHAYVERRIRELTEQIANEESAAEIEWQGRPLPFRSACRQIMIEPDHEKRRALEKAIAGVVEAQNATRAERIQGQREVAQQLGFSDYRNLCEELSGLSLQTLHKEMNAFLIATEEVYRARIKDALEREGVSLSEATDADLRWVILAPRHEALFPADRLVPAAEATLRALGTPLEQQENVHLDLEPRPKKYPRAFCCPIAVPGEIWVVVSPRGGCADFLSFFHEVGHAQHFSHMDPGLPAPYRLMGDNSISEGFGFILQSVVLERTWLCEVMGFEDVPQDLLETGQLLDFWYVRRYSGKIAYELELHSGDGEVTEMKPRYA